MVEINVERKKKPVWPWILLLLIVGLIIWAIVEMTNDNNETVIDENSGTGMVIPAHQLQPYNYKKIA
ncbi:hypothetical protein JAO76_08505 [Pontibacter sp. BT310]|uniref:Uncharacterized protein n=1 Tax=Pontibacter populi TaxID=890055 RepID=A0ABS6XAQ0_9BACT|nr:MULTISPECIES: hypothetical protein [Pontibacter]MBJ6118229.1 hypothetical protein [Pontibacter sp. BT310]MBR0570656.1 hypothetical protein [Microvirga sp. STS03]MBW3365082.1 hypothetical protein [Pontibacter populi]